MEGEQKERRAGRRTSPAGRLDTGEAFWHRWAAASSPAAAGCVCQCNQGSLLYAIRANGRPCVRQQRPAHAKQVDSTRSRKQSSRIARCALACTTLGDNKIGNDRSTARTNTAGSCKKVVCVCSARWAGWRLLRHQLSPLAGRWEALRGVPTNDHSRGQAAIGTAATDLC